MLCKNCGASLPDTAGFCSNCGAQIPQPPQPQPPQQQTYTPPQSQPQTYAPPAQPQYQQQQYQQPQYQQPQYQQPKYQQPQYQQPQYPQYQPQPQYPQKKKSSAGLIVLAAVLAVLLIGAVIWGVTLSRKLKAKKTDAQPGVTSSQQTDGKKVPAATEASEPADTQEPGADEAPSVSEADPVSPDAGAVLGKLEGYWNAASDPSAFVHFSAEQNGWAFSAGFYYSELDVYAHMDGRLEVGEYGFYHAHFSEPASGGRAAADFDLWIDASVIDDGMISCMMCRGEPDFSRMTVMRFAGRTEDEALPPLN